MPPEQTSNKSTVTLVVVFIVLAIGIYLLVKNSGLKSGGMGEITQENIVVKNVDINSAESKIPEGFPSNIPIEALEIYTSNSLDYTDRGVIQHSVSYKTHKSVIDKNKEYYNFMVKEGYVLAEVAKTNTDTFKNLYGSKDGDVLTVTMSFQGNRTNVDVVFLDRQ
jgi:hypothetical protein